MVGEWSIRGYSEKPSVQTTHVAADAPSLPLGQGEFDEPIGLPLIVVCQNVRLNAFISNHRWTKWICWRGKWDTKKNYSTLSNNF